MALVVLGKVVRAVGLRGHLGVAGTEGAIGRLERLTLRRAGDDVEVRIEEARPQGRIWAVKVAGVADRTEAERWVGAEVLADRAELGEAGESRHWWADLEGRPVVTVGGEEIGKVTGLYETGGVDVLVVTRDGQERLIPLAPYVEVDVAGGRIVVDPPDGLLDA
ncbi:MAG TPA: ribosome maturation factor RimM [Anaeromyxobacteraceae bacterium]|nr:ribosome maturation factor RimM [Anaeromyxobacteraceae bacterium]